MDLRPQDIAALKADPQVQNGTGPWTLVRGLILEVERLREVIAEIANLADDSLGLSQ